MKQLAAIHPNAANLDTCDSHLLICADVLYA